MWSEAWKTMRVRSRMSQQSRHFSIWIERIQFDSLVPLWPNDHSNIPFLSLYAIFARSPGTSNATVRWQIMLSMWVRRSFDKGLSVQKDRECCTVSTSTSSTVKDKEPKTYRQGSPTSSPASCLWSGSRWNKNWSRSWEKPSLQFDAEEVRASDEVVAECGARYSEQEPWRCHPRMLSPSLRVLSW